MGPEFNKDALSVVGWEPIIPALVSYFLTVRKVKEEGYKNGALDLSPCNLFLDGAPGTNKSGGALGLARFFNWVSEMIDFSTVDDAGEALGIINLHALSAEGRIEMIRSEVAESQMPVFDEIFNVAPHVARQFRLLLQGHYKAYGKPVQLDFRGIISTGNTNADLEGFGQMQPLDLATSKRYLFTVRVPRLKEMSRDARRALARFQVDPDLRRSECAKFAEKLAAAAIGAYTHYDAVNESAASEQITEYVLAILDGIEEDKGLCLEGREIQLFQVALTAAVALSWSNPTVYPVGKVMKDVTHALFRYVELMGVSPDFTKLDLAHSVGMEFINKAGIEALVLTAATLSAKFGLMLKHRHEVSLATKLDVAQQVAASPDLALKLATLQALATAPAAGGSLPAELAALIERSLPNPNWTLSIRDIGAVARLAAMSRAEQLVFKLQGLNEQAMDDILRQALQYVSGWT